MRVLRNGDPAAGRPVVRFNCKKCDALFEAERHEYTIETDRKKGCYYRARCPCCGEFVSGGELVKYEAEREDKPRWKSFGSM